MTTITLPRAVVEQALGALEWIEPSGLTGRGGIEARNKAITALRAALAQQAEQQPMHPELRKMWEDHFDKCFRAIPVPEQAEPVEPVAWFYQNMYTEQEYLVWKKGTGGRNWRPLYTAPPQRKPLTDEEIAAEWRKASEFAGKSEGAVTTSQFVQIFARAVERAHGIKE